jgi:sulfur carrier protein
MKIYLNGVEKRLPSALTVAQLLVDLGLAERRLAVEINQEIVPRSRHAERRLQDDDRVEVVVAVGGG